jgi:hypothetical protein
MIKFAFKIFFFIGIFTSLAVLYVYGQTAVFKVSYEINEKSEKLKDQSELYRRVKFEVDQLRAPRLLEEKMKSMELQLSLPSQIQVIRIPEASVVEMRVEPVLSRQPLAANPFDLLGRWVKVAQAKMES